MDCGHTVDYTEVHPEAEVPYCKRCGGLMRPNVIYFGEMPDRHVIEQARNIIAQGDLLLVAGTSLTVSPARYLIRSFAGTSVRSSRYYFSKNVITTCDELDFQVF